MILNRGSMRNFSMAASSMPGSGFLHGQGPVISGRCGQWKIPVRVTPCCRNCSFIHWFSWAKSASE